MTTKLKAIFFFISAFIAGAFTTDAQTRLGASLEGNLSTLSWRQDLFKVDQVGGFGAGVTYEMMFPGIGFGIDTGIGYQLKGANLHLGDKKIWEEYGTRHSYLHYIHIPLHLRFKWTRMEGIEDYVAPIVFGGPTVGFLAGHNSIDALQYAAADIGLEVGIGIELYKKWQITALHNWGMTYALKTRLLEDVSARNRSWEIKVTYFWK